MLISSLEPLKLCKDRRSSRDRDERRRDEPHGGPRSVRHHDESRDGPKRNEDPLNKAELTRHKRDDTAGPPSSSMHDFA